MVVRLVFQKKNDSEGSVAMNIASDSWSEWAWLKSQRRGCEEDEIAPFMPLIIAMFALLGKERSLSEYLFSCSILLVQAVYTARKRGDGHT